MGSVLVLYLPLVFETGSLAAPGAALQLQVCAQPTSLQRYWECISGPPA